MHKNITSCQGKHNKNIHNEIERVTTVTRGRNDDNQNYGREVIAFTLNKY